MNTVLSAERTFSRVVTDANLSPVGHDRVCAAVTDPAGSVVTRVA